MKALKFLFIAAVLVASLASCEAPHVFVDTKLKPNATEYAVEGRKNTFKNQMTIGEFAFTDIQYGSIKTNSSELFFKKQDTVKSKISFKMKYKGMEAETSCTVRAITKSLFFGKMEMPDDAKDEYIGQIQMKDSSAWDFNVKNLNSINWISPAGGCATNGTKRIEIKDVRKAEGTTSWVEPSTIFGYTYNVNNDPIAVVETIAGKGGVWIKKA